MKYSGNKFYDFMMTNVFNYLFTSSSDDEERLREELKDLIDDAPIEESGSDGEDSDASGGPKKRKKSDDELDDRLEDEDYDLIEENLGVKVARVSTYGVELHRCNSVFLLFRNSK